MYFVNVLVLVGQYGVVVAFSLRFVAHAECESTKVGHLFRKI